MLLAPRILVSPLPGVVLCCPRLRHATIDVPVLNKHQYKQCPFWMLTVHPDPAHLVELRVCLLDHAPQFWQIHATLPESHTMWWQSLVVVHESALAQMPLAVRDLSTLSNLTHEQVPNL